MTNRQLEWSTSTLFRIETGRSRPRPGNVRTLLELYGVTGAERDGLIQLTREARQPGWWHSFRDVLPNPYEVYLGLEVARNLPGLVVVRDSKEPDGVAAERAIESAHRALIGIGAGLLRRNRGGAGSGRLGPSFRSQRGQERPRRGRPRLRYRLWTLPAYLDRAVSG
jgi:Helix-turn-helix domain